MLGNAMSAASLVYVRQPRRSGGTGSGRCRAGPGHVSGRGHAHGADGHRQRDRPGADDKIDGLRIVFQHTPGAEAPAELCFYLPDGAGAVLAEITTHTLHNVYTLRGAKISRRQGLVSSTSTMPCGLFGDEAEVVFASHHWPTWGNARRCAPSSRASATSTAISTTRRYDLANHGYTYTEIAEQIELPDGHRQVLRQSRLLRLGQPQRQGHLCLLPRLVRRQSGKPSARDHETAKKYRRVHGWRGCGPREGPRDFEAGEYRWVGEGAQRGRLRRPGQPGGSGAAGRHIPSSSATRPRTGRGATSISGGEGAARGREGAADAESQPRLTSCGRCRSRWSSTTWPSA